MDEIKLNLENLTEEERETLMALVKKGNEAKPVRYKPKKYVGYWFINTGGEANQTMWYDTDFDNRVFALNNCFPTEEEAEAAAKKKRVLAKVEIFAKEHNNGEINWKNARQSKYAITYDYHSSKLLVLNVRYALDVGSVFFTSKEVAQACIDEMGDEIISAFVEG